MKKEWGGIEGRVGRDKENGERIDRGVGKGYMEN